MPCQQASGEADHFGISETKVMPVFVARRVGAQSMRPRPARPFTCICGLWGLQVRGLQADPTTWWWSLGHQEFKTHEDSTRGPGIQNSVNKVQDSTRIDIDNGGGSCRARRCAQRLLQSALLTFYI